MGGPTGQFGVGRQQYVGPSEAGFFQASVLTLPRVGTGSVWT